jgi:hypothetical protein
MGSESRHFGDEIHFEFGGVSGLKLKSFGGGLTQITGLRIANIADRRWSEIKWEIDDHENGVIFF